jgi:hypothetical protein
MSIKIKTVPDTFYGMDADDTFNGMDAGTFDGMDAACRPNYSN